MVFQLECSDEAGAHVELLPDGSARLFGSDRWDATNGAFTMTERQLAILRALINARDTLTLTLKGLPNG
jgi:hypothetical protein